MKRNIITIFTMLLLLVSCSNTDEEIITLSYTGEIDYAKIDTGSIIAIEQELDSQLKIIDNKLDNELIKIETEFQIEVNALYSEYRQSIQKIQLSQSNQKEVLLNDLENNLGKKEDILFKKYEIKRNNIENKRSESKEIKSQDIINKSNQLYIQEEKKNTQIHIIEK